MVKTSYAGKAYAALFSDEETEADYAGYERIEFDYIDQYFLKPVGITFLSPRGNNPDAEDGKWGAYNWIFIFDKNSKELCRSCISDTALSAAKDEPMLCLLFCNLPDELSAATRATYHSVIMGEIKAEDIPPRMYEAVNDELQRFGIPVIPCIRSGKAALKGSISTMPGFNDLAIAGLT